jgi:phosphatidate cytidylyltransferase
MKRVLTAVVLIPLVLLAVFRAPLWLFALLVAAIIVLALHEYLAIAEATGIKPFKWLTYVMSLMPFVLLWISGLPGERHYAKFSVGLSLSLEWATVLLVAAIVFGIPLVFRKDLLGGMAAAGASLFGVIYIGGSLSLLVALRADHRVLVIFVLFSVWAGDIAAYYVGRSFGKHKLAPIVSPNKSWEGAVASVLASVAISILLFHFHTEISKLFADTDPMKVYWLFPIPTQLPAPRVLWIHVVALGVLTNVAAQFGDLFESALKRGAGVKDSGTLLPGHGGVLDRIDALLFAIPVVWYYAQLTGFLLP